MTVPVPVAVNDAEQLDVVALMVVKLHGVPLKLPAAVPVFEKATVPAGALEVPTADVSLTNAVQVVACAIAIVEGAHTTEVVVVLRLIVTVLLVPVLPLCAVSVTATL